MMVELKNIYMKGMNSALDYRWKILWSSDTL